MKARVARCNVPQLATDYKRQLVVGEELDPMTREYERVGLAESECDRRYEVVLANEDCGHRNLQRRASASRYRKDPRILGLMDAHARAKKPPARQRDVDHRDDDEERDLRSADGFVKHVSDQQSSGEREEAGQPEGERLGRFSKRTGSYK